MKKIVVRAYLRQKWINLRQTQTTTISGPLYGYRRIHFTSGNAVFYIYLSIGLSLCHIPFVHSILECGRKLYFSGKLPLPLVNGGVILRSKGQRSRSLGMKM